MIQSTMMALDADIQLDKRNRVPTPLVWPANKGDSRCKIIGSYTLSRHVNQLSSYLGKGTSSWQVGFWSTGISYQNLHKLTEASNKLTCSIFESLDIDYILRIHGRIWNYTVHKCQLVPFSTDRLQLHSCCLVWLGIYEAFDSISVK